jgi:hypothetical protein
LSQTIHSVYAKVGSKSWLALGNNAGGTRHCWFNLATGVVGSRETAGWASSGIQDVGNGWYRCWGVALNSSNATYIRVAEIDNSVTCTSPGDIHIWGAQVEYVTTSTVPGPYIPVQGTAYYGPRFDYDPVTHAPKGLLIEESRINTAQSSQDFTQAYWTKTGVTVTADQIVAPDGTTTADLLTASAATATVVSGTSPNATAGQAWMLSVYAKKGTSDWFNLCALITSTGAQTPKAYFNLATGVVGTVDALITAATIQNVGNGWYRCAVTSLGTNGFEFWQAGICDANSSPAVTVGKTIYLWGAQAEIGAAANAGVTSYIPTPVGSNGTRAVDVATMTGSNFSSWYNQSQGTFVAEFDVFATGGTRGVMAADDTSTIKFIRLYGSSTDAKATISNTTTQADLIVGTFAAGTDTAATLPTTTQLRIGTESSTSGNTLSGHLRRIQFWNVAKSDADLQVLTNV